MSTTKKTAAKKVAPKKKVITINDAVYERPNYKKLCEDISEKYNHAIQQTIALTEISEQLKVDIERGKRELQTVLAERDKLRANISNLMPTPTTKDEVISTTLLMLNALTPPSMRDALKQVAHNVCHTYRVSIDKRQKQLDFDNKILSDIEVDLSRIAENNQPGMYTNDEKVEIPH